MRGLADILLYYLDFQPIVSKLSRLGVILFLLGVFAALAHNEFARTIILLSYIFTLAFPYMFTPLVQRELISNRHLALVPGFHMRAGMALFLYTILLAIVPFIFDIFESGTVTPWRSLAIFSLASAYSGFYGLILPTPYVLPLGAVVPLGLLFLDFLYKPLINAMFHDPGFLLTAAVISILGWIYGLVVLSRKNYFQPIYASTPLTTGKSEVISGDAFAADLGRLSRFQIGPPRSAAGTLLSGYGDGMVNRMLLALHRVAITPLLFSLFLLLVECILPPPNPAAMTRIFLFFSMFFGIVGLGSGELAARGRLLWLRAGADRLWLWRFMETYILTALGLNVLIAALICIIFMPASGVPGMQLWYYMIMIICGGLFFSYLSLSYRIHNWPYAATATVIIITLGFLVIISIIVLLGKEPYTGILVGNPLVFTIIPGGLLILSTLLRVYAKHGFIGIDWLIVKPIRVSRRSF